MLNRVASRMQCAPVELGHWLINKREARKPRPRYRQLMLPLDFGDDRSD